MSQSLKKLVNFLTSSFEVMVKKGCTEYSNSYPEYKKFDSKQSEIGKGWNKLEEIITITNRCLEMKILKFVKVD